MRGRRRSGTAPTRTSFRGPSETAAPAPTSPAGAGIQLIPRWDLNRDGYLDVVFNQDHNPVENVDAFIYWGSAEGYRSLFPPFWKEVLPTYKLFKSLVENRRHISFLPTFGGGPVRVADLNRDGYPDIVFPNTIHNYTVHMEIYIYWGGPHGYSVVRRQSLPTLFGRELEVADLNRDGWPDIVVANYGEESGHRQGYRLHRESYVYWGAPDGFSAERRTSIPTLSAISCTVGDFDGDGWADLAFANNNLEHQSLSLHWGSSAGFDGARRLDLEAGNPRLVRAADLDLDGRDDLVVFSGKTSIGLLRCRSNREIPPGFGIRGAFCSSKSLKGAAGAGPGACPPRRSGR